MNPNEPGSPYDTDVQWRQWGERDPYFGVITQDRFRRQNLTTEALEEFFHTGRSHAQGILRRCRRQFGADFAPRRLLDFGCGVGRLLVAFGELVPEVVGVDISEAMLAEARRNCDVRGQGKVQLRMSDAELSQVEGDFDLIHSVIVFQHIEPIRGTALAGKLIDKLRPGGIAVLHFTYAKAWFADSYGQAPPPRQWSRSVPGQFYAAGGQARQCQPPTPQCTCSRTG